jgi:uncharacterized protein (TIGR03000 family)
MRALQLGFLAVVTVALLVSAALVARVQETSDGATITLTVPADAEVVFNGKATTQTGTERIYRVPPLEKGKSYSYDVVVRWKKDGKVVEEKKTIEVRMGANVRVAFGMASPDNGGTLTEEDAFKLAKEAYVYGYPLVTMEMTRRVMTNVAEPRGTRAPMGQFVNMREYPTAAFRDVTAPNADTLYSAAWLDLSKEPYVFSIPEAKDDRYYLMPILNAWTSVFEVPGKRTTGTKAQKYLITGPGWKGDVPEGVKEYKSSTAMVWILGRTYCTGTPEDYKAAHAFQDGLSLVPLSAYGKEYTPPKGKVDSNIDMDTSVRDQVNQMKAVDFFKLLAQLLKDNPPAKGDAAMVEKLAALGIMPGKEFDVTKLNPAMAKAIERAVKPAQEEIVAHRKDAGVEVNGWMYSTRTGIYGTDYLQRAFITYFGLGANRPKDAIYPSSEGDDTRKAYTGADKYVIHFDKGKLPPVNAFWSITMYNDKFFFVDNPLNKYTVSPRNNLKENDDGSVDIYVQHESPGKDKEANWLPAPEGKFVLMMRMYWPKEKDPSILDGSWKPPAAKKVSS